MADAPVDLLAAVAIAACSLGILIGLLAGIGFGRRLDA